MKDFPVTEHRLTPMSASLAWLIILAGLWPRFELAQRLALDFDESMYFQAANEPSWAGTWEASQVHTHPPLAFLMYHPWLAVGTSEVVLRLPSIVCGVVATWIAYLWLARRTDRRAALVAAFVLTFAMPVLHVESQMRSYSFLLLFLFGAMWFNERFRESRQLRFLSGECVCLLLSLWTHYAAAWVIGVLGVIGLVRAGSWGWSSRATRGWVVSQCLLAGVCVALYVTHVRTFVGGSTQDGLWSFWMHGNRFGDSLAGRFQFAMVSGSRFFGSLFGFLWVPMLCVTGAGAVLFARSSSALERTWHDGIERALWVVLPFAVAIALQALKVYPFGSTRHSLWLLPFLVLAIAAAVRPVLNKPLLTWKVSVAAVCLAWAWWYPVRFVSQHTTKLTPELMRQTVNQLRSSVSRGDLILTDEAARNVLSYYLGPSEVDRGRKLPQGFREYRIDGFRVVTIPQFHFFLYSLREDWNSFVSGVGEHSTKPMWLVHMGFEVPGNDLPALGQRLPPTKLLARRTIGDNHLLHLQFREPDGAKSLAATRSRKP